MSGNSWTIAGGGRLEPAPFLVMAILNLTPDSFSDQGRYQDQDKAVDRVREIFDQGADIIDLGAESTRPFSRAVTTEEELGRLLPVLTSLAGLWPDQSGPALSVDTRRAETARQALEAGAGIINDVSAGRFDPGLTDILAHFRPGYVLMHSQGQPETMQTRPRYDAIMAELASFFESHLSRLVRAGLPEENIVLDPGIGFGKTLEHNLEILRHMGRLKSLGRPLLLGLSNKTFLGELLGLDVAGRGPASLAATALMTRHDLAVHRVHDVKNTAMLRELIRAIGKA